MKRIDYYIGLSLISFILCIGFANVHIGSLSDYFLYLQFSDGDNGNLLITISVLCLLMFTICSFIEIMPYIKKAFDYLKKHR